MVATRATCERFVERGAGGVVVEERREVRPVYRWRWEPHRTRGVGWHWSEILVGYRCVKSSRVFLCPPGRRWFFHKHQVAQHTRCSRTCREASTRPSEVARLLA
jgi:hypothetical protein